MTALLAIADAVRGATPRSSSRSRPQNTGKPKGLTMSEEIGPMVDQFRFFAGAARMLEGKAAGRVHGRARRPTCAASRSASSAR